MTVRHVVPPGRLAVLALALALAAGCDGPQGTPAGVAVGGKVLLPGGSPLAGGTLVLRPVAGIHGASAQVRKDGSFELADPGGNPSVVPGRYQVFVRFNSPDQKALRAAVSRRYQDSEDGDSDVVVDIRGPQNDLVVRLNP
jgi:hypothetical protein